ncbi:hypothetical protein AB0M39_27880 [Streptomyces sp. NPDC051907]|uniref:hypothetical protein n=1 Tax=Streptomyces sp. NPDC051907 TaxID=3155284 RepID=UPI00341EE366
MADDPEGQDPPDGPSEPPVPGPEEEQPQQPQAQQDDLDQDAQPGDDPDPQPRAERTAPDEQEEDGKGYDDLRVVFGRQVHNNFYGTVDATGAAFGMGTGAAPGLSPGTVEPEEVDRALRCYLAPRPCFGEALDKLRADHIVVLTGPGDCGRGASSFALLRAATEAGAALRSLSPANSLAELAASSALKPGQAYVILDYVGERNVAAVQAFDIRRLGEELRRKGSYLVITAGEDAQRRLALREYCVPWQAPDPLELLDHCALRLPPADIPPGAVAELRERVAELRRPADVVAVAARLPDGVEAALKTLGDSDRELVRGWFAAEPGAGDLLPLAALVFLDGVPERTFEKASFLLGAYVRDWEQSGELPAADPDAAAATAPRRVTFEQTRARWQERTAGLVRTERRPGPGQDSSRSERRVVFASPRIRELVVGELHDLYGYQLWYPLRQWLGHQALEGDLTARAEVAKGVALYARHALAEVDESLLQAWSDGLTNQRVTAALALQFMCEDEHLAPQALNLALSWAVDRGPDRAVTTAMALSGRLGCLYRLQALNWVWFLTTRGERIAFAARRSLVLLLQTAEQDAERALFTLRYVRTRIKDAEPRSRDLSNALRATVQLLESERLEEPGTVAAALLRETPGSARQLGSLWASVLHSVCRRRAVGALCRTLAALRDDPAAADAVRELGEAMRAETQPRQWTALQHDLSIALRHPDYAIPGTRRLADVLLGSMRSRPAASGSGRPPARSRIPVPVVSSVQGGRSK